MKLEILHQPAAASANRHPPILFVHGFFGSAQVWTPHFMPFFSGQGYDCHAFSLRGHGASDGMLSWAGLAEFGEDLVTLIASLPEPPVLIGHSLGGLLIQHALAHHPCRAAVLLASLPPSGLGSSAMHMSMLAPQVVWQVGLLQSLGPEAVSAETMTRAFLSDAATPAETRRLMLLLQRESPRVAAEVLAPSQPLPPRGADRPPILVLGGDTDIFLPVSAFRETATFFGADLRLLAGAPHALMLDDRWWQTSADSILSWLAQHSV